MVWIIIGAFVLFSLIAIIPIKLQLARVIQIFDSQTAEPTTIILEPCPFCGKNKADIIAQEVEDKVHPEQKIKIYAMYCDDEHGGCGSMTGWYASQLEAVKAWNERAYKTND